MRKPPALATGLLRRLGSSDDSLVGDLVEEFHSGRSRAWYWRQVLYAIALGTIRQTATAPLPTLRGVASGWGTLFLLFFTLGDAATEALSEWLFGWTRVGAYATQVFWPFPIVAVLVSYFGFALSGVGVARLQGRRAGPALVAYVASVAIALVAAAAVVEFLSRRGGYVSGPPFLFYIVSVTLPYQWRTGLLLAPAVAFLAGLLAGPRRSAFEHLTPEA